MKKYVWAYPMVAIVIITVMAMFLQSCGVVRLDEMTKAPTAEEIDKKIKAVQFMCLLTLVMGVSFCGYIYSEVKRLDGKIVKLTTDRE